MIYLKLTYYPTSGYTILTKAYKSIQMSHNDVAIKCQMICTSDEEFGSFLLLDSSEFSLASVSVFSFVCLCVVFCCFVFFKKMIKDPVSRVCPALAAALNFKSVSAFGHSRLSPWNKDKKAPDKQNEVKDYAWVGVDKLNIGSVNYEFSLRVEEPELLYL